MLLARPLLILLIVLNVVVILGHLWPEGAPPFARVVNIVTLVADLLVLIGLLRGRRTADA
jgi:hypothetical protein